MRKYKLIKIKVEVSVIKNNLKLDLLLRQNILSEQKASLIWLINKKEGIIGKIRNEKWAVTSSILEKILK